MKFKEKQPKFNSQLFLNSIYRYKNEVGLKLKIAAISDLVNSKFDKKRHSIFLNFEVMDNFPECLNYVYDEKGVKKIDENGKPQKKREDPRGFIVGLPFQVNITPYNNIKISQYSNLYNIIYPVAISKKIAQPGVNYEDVTFTITELKDLLKDVEFIGIVKQVKKTNYKPYLRLEVKQIIAAN